MVKRTNSKQDITIKDYRTLPLLKMMKSNVEEVLTIRTYYPFLNNVLSYSTCNMCGNKIMEFDKYFEYSGTKICVDCIELYVDKLLVMLNKIKNKIESNKKIIERNKERWKKERMLNRIDQ